MFLSDKYKAESFPNQYYEVSRAPFVLMGIEPESKLAWLILDLHAFRKKYRSFYFIKDNRLDPDIYTWFGNDEEFSAEVKNNEEELLGLATDYFSIYLELSASSLLFKFGVNDFILTNKLLEFGKSSKLPPGEPKDLLGPKDDEGIKGTRDRQIAFIRKTAEKLGYDLLNIPIADKAAVKTECLKNTNLFTSSGFDHAWTEANKRGVSRVQDKDKFL